MARRHASVQRQRGNAKLQMIIDSASGWLHAARIVPSPNFDSRPRGELPSLIVIHGISLPPGRFGEAWIDRLFLNALPAEVDPYFATISTLKVSSHVLIDRVGEVTQYVSFGDRAWHAGQSMFCGRGACNDFSIGIELEGLDDVAYTEAQYSKLADLIRALRSAYPSLRTAPIVGHSDIAPGRKTDPGPAFDWLRLGRALARQT